MQMTNEQAIVILRDTPIDIRSTREDDIHTLYAMAQNMAIEALSNNNNQTNSELKTTTDSVSATDVIYRADAIDAIDGIDWYHQNRNKDMVSGANPSEHQAWYKADDVYKALEQIPSAQPEIIRCKDCKYAEVADPKDSQDGYTCQFHRGSIWFSGSYCSWAERRTDG